MDGSKLIADTVVHENEGRQAFSMGRSMSERAYGPC